MQKANRLQVKWRNVVFFLTASLIVTADQLSKVWIKTNLEVGHSIPEVGFPRLTHVTNTGSAFGLFQGQTFLLAIVALVSVVVLLLYALLFYRRFPFLDNWLTWVGLSLILGGTVGNLIERVCHLIDPLRFAGVTDFIDFGFWPAFNLADSAVVVGVIIFAYSLFPLARAGKL